MNNPLKLAIAAGAVFTAGIIGLNLLPGSNQQGPGAPPTPDPTATAAPTVAPSASPIPFLPGSGVVIEPGRYRLLNWQVGGMSLSIEVPAGWTVETSDMIAKNRGFLDSEAGVLFAFWPISGTFVDPCTDHTLVRPTPGPGIDALAEALADQPGTEAGPPSAVTVDGYPGKVIDSTVTADIEPCGKNGFWLWAWPDGQPRWVQGTDELNRMFIVDVDGERLTFNGRYPAGTTAADRAELDAIIASIDIEPAMPPAGTADSSDDQPGEGDDATPSPAPTQSAAGDRPGASLIRVAGNEVSVVLPDGLADLLPADGDAGNGITWGNSDDEYGRTGSRWRMWSLYAPADIDDPSRDSFLPLSSDAVAWLRQRPGLTVLAERDVEVGGEPARLLDVVRPEEGGGFSFEVPVGDGGAPRAFVIPGGTHSRLVVWQLGHTWMVAEATAIHLGALEEADAPDDPFMRFIADLRHP